MSSSDLAQASIGSDRRPTEVTIFDYNLWPVYDGVTPVTQHLPSGTYEIELRSGSEIDRHIVRLGHGSGYDGTKLGLDLNTPVPISAASDRNQAIAEAATTLSSKLHRSRQKAGLALLLINVRDERINVTPNVTVLDSNFEPVPEFRKLAVNANQYWRGQSAALQPGGYLIRTEVHVAEQSTEQLDVPVWVSTGYQTLVFIPYDTGPRPDRMSLHMTPMSEIWTGFDTAANALELAMQGWRNGRCLLADARSSDMLELATRNPMFGIVAAYSLRYSNGADDIWSALVDHLADVVPDHPDVVILSNQSVHMNWPPGMAAGYRRLLRADAVDRAAIGRGSLAEAASAELLLLGPWTAWKALRSPEGSRVGAGPPAATVASRPAGHGLGGVWRLFLTRLKAWRLNYALAHSDVTSVAQVLRTALPGEAAVDRVRIYLSSVLELRGMRELRRSVGGRTTRRVATATSLSLSVARQAIAEIDQRIQQELKRKSANSGPAGPPTQGLRLGAVSFADLAVWLSPAFVIAAGLLAGLVAKLVLGAHLNQAQISVFMLAGATSAVTATWKWLQGWQKHVWRVAGRNAFTKRQPAHGPSPTTVPHPHVHGPSAQGEDTDSQPGYQYGADA